MKTVIDLMREYVRVSDMCDAYNKEHGTDVKPWECVKYSDNDFFKSHPNFNWEISGYEFAVAILEGRPVFVGDEIFGKMSGEGFDWDNWNDFDIHNISLYYTWTKPTRTFTLNGVAPVVDRLDEDYALDIGRKYVYWFRSREDRDAALHALKNILDEAKK